MPNPHSVQVLIAGAGPAGAVLAHLLATRGLDVTLLERQSDFAREFRGEVLMPSGLAVLDALGLGARLDRVPRTHPTSFRLNVGGERIFDVPFDPDAFGGRLPEVVSQPALLEALVSDVEKKSPSFSFVRGASVKEVVREDGRVVGVRARSDRGEEHFRAQLLIGCDGRASAVRRAGGFELEREELPMDIVWCKLPPPPGPEGERAAYFSIEGGHLFVSYIAPDGLLQVAWVILKGSYAELKSRGVEQWVGEMARFAPAELADHLRANAERFVHPFLLDTAANRVGRWSAPGALLLGDAAHTMSPVGGQGVNIALRDALVAANHLVPVFARGGDASAIDAAAAKIEAERIPEVRRIQALQSLPPRLVISRSWLAERLRSVPKLLRYAPVQRLAARNVRPFFYGTTDVTLRV